MKKRIKASSTCSSFASCFCPDSILVTNNIFNQTQAVKTVATFCCVVPSDGRLQ